MAQLWLLACEVQSCLRNVQTHTHTCQRAPLRHCYRKQQNSLLALAALAPPSFQFLTPAAGWLP